MSEANVEQRQYWNEVSGPKWVRTSDTVNAQIEGLGRVMIDALAPADDAVVMDVGCGCGHTSLELARRASAGRVVGVDVSQPMLDDARRRAKEAGLDNLSFVEADAQTHAFEPASFDAIFSRFGVMFFEDPVAAFRNLRGALRPGGRLVFVCWQPLARNAWVAAPLGAIAKHVPLPQPNPGPGPFAFADDAVLRAHLEGAGFADVDIRSIEQDVPVAAGLPLDEAVEFMLEMGPAGAAMRDVEDEAVRDAVRTSVREVLQDFARPDGIWLGAAVWGVDARA